MFESLHWFIPKPSLAGLYYFVVIPQTHLNNLERLRLDFNNPSCFSLLDTVSPIGRQCACWICPITGHHHGAHQPMRARRCSNCHYEREEHTAGTGVDTLNQIVSVVWDHEWKSSCKCKKTWRLQEQKLPNFMLQEHLCHWYWCWSRQGVNGLISRAMCCLKVICLPGYKRHLQPEA